MLSEAISVPELQCRQREHAASATSDSDPDSELVQDSVGTATECHWTVSLVSDAWNTTAVRVSIRDYRDSKLLHASTGWM